MLEVTALDRWVDASRGDDPGEGEGGDNPGDGAAAAGEEGGERPSGRLVKLPECPQCRTAIRRNQRYGTDGATSMWLYTCTSLHLYIVTSMWLYTCTSLHLSFVTSGVAVHVYITTALHCDLRGGCTRVHHYIFTL